MILSTSLLALLAADVRQPVYFYVDRRQFDCVVRSIDIYLAESDNPAIVYLDECDQVARRGALPPARLFPPLPSLGHPAGAPAKIDTVISLTRTQMECLKRGGLSLRNYAVRALPNVYRLPVDFCGRRTR